MVYVIIPVIKAYQIRDFLLNLAINNKIFSIFVIYILLRRSFQTLGTYALHTKFHINELRALSFGSVLQEIKGFTSKQGSLYKQVPDFIDDAL